MRCRQRKDPGLGSGQDPFQMAEGTKRPKREQATLEILDCMECFYNRVRIHPALGWLSPDEYEDRYYESSRTQAT